MKSKSEMSAILNIFSNSAMDALSKQFNILSELVKSVDTSSQNLVTGAIEIDCNKFKGQIRIHFEQSSLIKMYNSVFDEELGELDDENTDFAGEVMNILYCLAKDDLSNERGFDLKPEIPKVLKNTKVFSHSSKVFFKTEHGFFFLELFENNWATQIAS